MTKIKDLIPKGCAAKCISIFRWPWLGLFLFLIGLFMLCLPITLFSYGLISSIGIIGTIGIISILAGLLLMIIHTREDSTINKQSTSETIEKAADRLAKHYHEDKDLIKELLTEISNYESKAELGKAKNE